MAPGTRDELLREARTRTRQEIEEHESRGSAWASTEPIIDGGVKVTGALGSMFVAVGMADYVAELLDYVDPADLEPVARIYV